MLNWNVYFFFNGGYRRNSLVILPGREVGRVYPTLLHYTEVHHYCCNAVVVLME